MRRRQRRRMSVFPARAGMSPAAPPQTVAAVGFPRPRGDEPVALDQAIKLILFSPPARG